MRCIHRAVYSATHPAFKQAVPEMLGQEDPSELEASLDSIGSSLNQASLDSIGSSLNQARLRRGNLFQKIAATNS